MSRLNALSQNALRAMFSPESDDAFIILLTLTPSVGGVIRLSDNPTQRLSETADDITYGTISRGQQFKFLPLEIALPTETETGAPRATVTIHNVTRQLTPAIREAVGALPTKLEVVLASNPDIVEVAFANMLLGSITYNAETVSGELTFESLDVEPFPSHTITPAYFPGCF